MTKEGAIEILIESKRQNEIMRDNPNNFFSVSDVVSGEKNARKRIDALDIAIRVLREQQERENPKPLTLVELRKMDGESVWLKDGRCFIVNTEHPKGPVGIEKHGMATSLDLLAEIGLYRHKPKEEPK